MRKLLKDRAEKLLFKILVKELNYSTKNILLKKFRMVTKIFEEILSWVSPSIQKSSLIDSSGARTIM